MYFCLLLIFIDKFILKLFLVFRYQSGLHIKNLLRRQIRAPVLWEQTRVHTASFPHGVPWSRSVCPPSTTIARMCQHTSQYRRHASGYAHGSVCQCQRRAPRVRLVATQDIVERIPTSHNQVWRWPRHTPFGMLALPRPVLNVGLHGANNTQC